MSYDYFTFQYLKEEYSDDDKDDMFRFCFMDPVNGFIELDVVKTFQDGWTIDPIRKPLRVGEHKHTV